MASLNSGQPERRGEGVGVAGIPARPHTSAVPAAHSPANFDDLSMPRLDVVPQVNAPCVKKEPETKVREPVLRPSLLITAFRESTEIVVSSLKDGIAHFDISPAIVRFGKIALGSTFCVTMVLDTTGTLGMLGTAVVFGSAAFKRFDHSRAQNISGGVVLALHTALLGDLTATLAGTVGTLRNIVQGMIPDGRTGARTASAIIGAAGGIAVFSLYTSIFPLVKVDNIPAVATVLFALGGALPKERAWLARSTGLMGCASFIPYHLTRVEMSIPSLILASGMSAIILGNIVRTDLLPKLRGTKKKEQPA